MSINKVILVGNVGGDPEVRHLDENTMVANFSLATTERGFTTRDGKAIPDRTEWHRVVAWRGLAKLADSYIRKGTQLYIEGKLQTRQYKTKEGQDRYSTDIVADVIQLLGRKGDNPGGAGAPISSSAPQANNQQAAPAQTPSYGQPNLPTTPSAPSTPPSFGDPDNSEDDLPF